MYKRDNLKGRGKNEEGIQGEKWRALCDYGTSEMCIRDRYRRSCIGGLKNADRWAGSDVPETLERLYTESSEWFLSLIHILLICLYHFALDDNRGGNRSKFPHILGKIV